MTDAELSIGLMIQLTLIFCTGIALAVGFFTAMAKVPGPWRWLFRKVVRDPVRDGIVVLIDERTKTSVEKSVDSAIATRDQSMKKVLDQINQAVNNVGPGVPNLKDRVEGIDERQKEMKVEVFKVKEHVASIDGKVDTVIALMGGSGR